MSESKDVPVFQGLFQKKMRSPHGRRSFFSGIQILKILDGVVGFNLHFSGGCGLLSMSHVDIPGNVVLQKLWKSALWGGPRTKISWGMGVVFQLSSKWGSNVFFLVFSRDRWYCLWSIGIGCGQLVLAMVTWYITVTGGQLGSWLCSHQTVVSWYQAVVSWH